MKPKAIAVYLAVAASALAAAPSAFGARTVTIGSVTQPAFSYAEQCNGRLAWQASSMPAKSFAVPADGSAILSWQTNIEADEAGAAETLVVLRPTSISAAEYEVVGTDTETLPESTPGNEIASFTLASPMPVRPGDVLGIYGASPNITCAYSGGETPDGSRPVWRGFESPPLAGEAFGPEYGYIPGIVDVAATVALPPLPPIDIGVSTSVAPVNAVAGQSISLTSLITNHDSTEADGDVTVTDAVPAGLTISAAAVGDGVCRVEGQSVTCTVAPLAASESVPLIVAAQAGAAGTYVNKVSVLGSRADANPANDHAEAALTVLSAAATQVPVPAPAKSACEVPRLRTVALAAAKRVLRALRCKPGHVRKTHSRKVAKGGVVSTAPGPGAYALGRSVTIVVSSGRAHAHHHSSGAKHNNSTSGAKHKGKRRGAKRKGSSSNSSAASRIDQRKLT